MMFQSLSDQQMQGHRFASICLRHLKTIFYQHVPDFTAETQQRQRVENTEIQLSTSIPLSSQQDFTGFHHE